VDLGDHVWTWGSMAPEGGQKRHTGACTVRYSKKAWNSNRTGSRFRNLSERRSPALS
jgi:hypothetical protein